MLGKVDCLLLSGPKLTVIMTRKNKVKDVAIDYKRTWLSHIAVSKFNYFYLDWKYEK